MKPALSIVVFTVLSGAGFGLAVYAALFAGAGAGEVITDARPVFIGVALALIIGGLGASTLHLANVKNAWRAVMRARTSWLSREAILAAAFIPLLCLYLLIDAAAFRALLAALALLVIYSTAMIYQSLKTIRQWHHPLTSINYLALGLMSGGVLFVALASSLIDGGDSKTDTPGVALTLAFTLAAGGAKIAHYRRIGACEDISVAAATGLSRGAARLLDAGHTGETFLTREFIYKAGALQTRRRLAGALMFGGALVAVVAGAAGIAAGAWLGATAMFAGLLLERWLFFAEARHSIRAYHGVS